MYTEKYIRAKRLGEKKNVCIEFELEITVA